MKNKKVILFVVEGINDRVSLEEVLFRLIDPQKIQFHIINGDITADNESSTGNIRTKLDEHIKHFINRNRYNKNDILSVIQLIDTDGAFIPEEKVLCGEKTAIKYTQDNILTANREPLLNRNRRKSSIVRMLSTTAKISNHPYSVFFFSRNFEHALHNKSEVLSEIEKIVLSEEFGIRMGENPQAFINLIFNSEISVKGSYKQTWEYIFCETNSLHRGSNFHLFFSNNSELLSKNEKISLPDLIL